MTAAKFELLQEELTGLKQAAWHLDYSRQRCLDLVGFDDLPPEQLERLESLTSRFARLADLLIQRIFRLIDDIELVSSGTILDRLFRAEKRGWASAADLIKIRELQNLIAHEYAADQMTDIYTAVTTMTPLLLVTVPKVAAYANQIPHYPNP